MSSDDGGACDRARMGDVEPGCGQGDQQVCETDADCEQYVEDYVRERLSTDLGAPGDLVVAECLADCGQGPACGCLFDRDDREDLDRVSVYVLGGSDRCDVVGRAHQCLVPPSELDRCEVGTSGSCQAQCEALGEKLAIDLGGYEVTVRATRCQERSCVSVLELAGECYAGVPLPEPGAEPVDCAEGDDALLDAAYAQASVPSDPELSPEARRRQESERALDAGAADSDREPRAPDASARDRAAPPSDAGVDAGPAALPDAGPEPARSPIEANWETYRDEGGPLWITAHVCGAELGPVCVEGDCADASVPPQDDE